MVTGLAVFLIGPVCASRTPTWRCGRSVWERYVGLVLLDPLVLGVVHEEERDEGDVRPLIIASNLLPIDAIDS